MRLALDAMRGDHAPSSPVEGALLFAREFPAHEVVLVGNEGVLRPLLGARPPNVSVRHASEVVEEAGGNIEVKPTGFTGNIVLKASEGAGMPSPVWSETR